MIFFQTYTTGTRLIIESKNRLGATALANQKMEIMRSLDYDAIGTTTGIPSGDLVENETISVNTTKYEVYTFVQYVDDAFDGTAALGTDTIPTDYKRARVTVSWGNLGTDQTVTIFGNFSPKGVETSGGGGVLTINILDGTGSGIPSVSVQIINSAASINTTGVTDSTGNLTLPGAPAGTEAYTIVASKNGYYGVTTYPPYPTSAYTPIDTHASVVAGALNQKTLVIDQSSDITFDTKDALRNSIPNIVYSLKGGRLLGAAPVTLAPVYGFNQAGNTGSSGSVSFPGESVGQYNVTASDANYEFWKLAPEGTIVNQFTAFAGIATPVTAIFFDKNIGSVKVVVTNTTGTALAGASVKLTSSVISYDTTVVTDQYGIAYFPTALPALVPETYAIEVSLSGYVTDTDSVSVSGALETKTIPLTAN